MTGIVYATYTFEATIGECVSEANCKDDYVINNLSHNVVYCASNGTYPHHYETFTDAIYTVSNNLSTNGSIPIASGYDYTFTAGNEIHLNNGFSAAHGSEFKAIIQNCTPVSSGLVQKTAGNNMAIDTILNDSTKYITSKNAIDQNLYILVTPNPSDGNMTVSYNLFDRETGIFEIYDILGKKRLSYQLYSGKNAFSISDDKIEKGIYFYKAFSGNKLIAADKIVVIK